MATHEHIIFLTLRFAISFLQRSCPRRLNEARDCVPFSVALMPSSAQRVPHFKTNTYGGAPCSVASISMGRDCTHGCMHSSWGSLLSSPCFSSEPALSFHLSSDFTCPEVPSWTQSTQPPLFCSLLPVVFI